MPTRGQGVAAMRAERPHLLPRALPPPRLLWTLSRSHTLRAPTARSPCLSPRPRSRPPLMAEQSSPPQPFSPLPAFSLPTSTTLSFAAISFTPCSCSCSPSQPATLAVEAPAAATAAGARAWPSRRGPPWAKPSSPAGAQGPLGASPSLPRRRRTFSGRNSKLRPSSALFFRPGTSHDNSTKVKGLAAMS